MTDLFHGIRARLRMFGEGIFWRNIVAFLGVLVLVVTDAIPVLNGLPDTVRAADAMPKTGTIIFLYFGFDIMTKVTTISTTVTNKDM